MPESEGDGRGEHEEGAGVRHLDGAAAGVRDLIRASRGLFEDFSRRESL